MPITVKLKSKDPKFEGDRAAHYIVATGATGLFTPQLERFMFLHGMNGMGKGGGEISSWSSTPSIGGEPTYLAVLLRDKYNFAPCRDTRIKIKDAIGADLSDANSLDHFIGRGKKTVNRGKAELTVFAGSREFVANCTAENYARRKFLEGAGWLPIENPSEKLRAAFGSRPYKTADPFIASNLETLMPEKARKAMRSSLARAHANIKMSQSQSAPEGFDIPAPEGIDYFDFQKGGINAVVQSGKGALIADDMGLGKTIQGIGVLNGRPSIKRAIFFCQANMKLKWVREIEKWKINEDLSVGHAEGKTFPDTDIVVINYDIAQKNMDKIRAIDWDLVVTDEAHNLKNVEAQRTQAILGDLDSEAGLPPIPLAAGGQIVHMTGTPKPNRIAELWPLLTTSRPDIWGSGPRARQAFLNRYEPPFLIEREIAPRGGTPYKKVIPLPGKPQRELELQLRMRGSGSFIRRLKRDTDMPAKMRTPIEMPFRLSKEDRELLAEVEADLAEISERITGKKLQAGVSVQAKEVIDVVAGVAPGSPHFSEIARVRRNLAILKAPHAARFIVEELQEDKDFAPELRRKTVVFAHHKDVIRILAERAEKAFPGGVVVYDGSSKGTTEAAQAKVDAFQTDPAKRLFIMSLSGATGITLTAAHRMRVTELDWSPSNMVQIEDRIWRIGQEEDCEIGYLFVPNSLDVKMGLALHAKMETDERATNTLSFAGMRSTRKKVKSGKTPDPLFGGAASKTKAKTAPPPADDYQMELSI